VLRLQDLSSEPLELKESDNFLVPERDFSLIGTLLYKTVVNGNKSKSMQDYEEGIFAVHCNLIYKLLTEETFQISSMLNIEFSTLELVCTTLKNKKE
jgi:hypothetical protein